MEIKITVYQLFSLMLMLPYATAALYFLAPELQQNVWIGILIYIIPSIAVQYIYMLLFRKYPRDTLATYMPKIWGKFIGTTISIVYILYFAYIAARDLRDFVELLLTDVTIFMPPYVIYICIITIVIYGIYKGFEVVARIAGVVIIIFIVFLIIESVFLLITPHAVDLTNLLPIAEDGLVDVIKKGWPLITFPYGELVVFTMLYSCVNQPEKVRKASYGAVVAEGIILSLVNIMFITTLGAEYAALSLFPHIVTMRLVKFGGFINRFDVLVVILMIYGAFFKISVLSYVSVLGATQLLKLKDVKTLVIPFCIVITIVSGLLARNYPEHIKLGLDFTVKYIHLPIQIVIPSITLMVCYVKNGFLKIIN